VVHDHENVVKASQHHRLAPGALPHDVLDGIISHVVQVTDKKTGSFHEICLGSLSN